MSKRRGSGSPHSPYRSRRKSSAGQWVETSASNVQRGSLKLLRKFRKKGSKATMFFLIPLQFYWQDVENAPRLCRGDESTPFQSSASGGRSSSSKNATVARPPRPPPPVGGGPARPPFFFKKN